MKCDRPGCTGIIEDDGYCDVCGHKFAGRAHQPAANPSKGLGTGLAPGHATAASVAVSGSASTGSASTGPMSSITGTGVGGTRSSAPSSVRGNLGAGLVEVPPVVSRDPESVLMRDPHVPESKRYCAHCDEPVGRSRNARPGLADGYCRACGKAYSFTPKLTAGDLVAGQYEVAGCLAHGGMGWVYLARDHNVDDRWVVLKGLLNAGDEYAMAAAIVERGFLAKVKHQNIVEIYNSVQHEGDGYIVMEYVGGKSLKELRRDDSGAPAPMPVAQAIAYMLAVLPAMEYLHGRGLLYCDFKPDNVIHTDERVTIIDLGGVHRIGDESSDLYGTVGYQAPEVPQTGPSVASDLYTVARTLAVLVFDFRGFQDPGRYRDSLPLASEVAAFTRYPGLYRFLVKGAHPTAQRRFQSAGEMAEQLLGVLRQVTAIDGQEPDPAPSKLFTPELTVDTERPTWRNLPVPAVNRDDPSAGVLATLAAAPPAQLLTALEGAPTSPDVSFQRARAYLELDEWQKAAEVVVAEATGRGEDWRVCWWEGVLDLADGDWNNASAAFEKVAAELPGELAPLLAWATAEESDGDYAGAASRYDLVSATDPGYGLRPGPQQARRARPWRHGRSPATRSGQVERLSGRPGRALRGPQREQHRGHADA
jgi:serine/threonine-protein kinase PknG